jgi:hypothetical protein
VGDSGGASLASGTGSAPVCPSAEDAQIAEGDTRRAGQCNEALIAGLEPTVSLSKPDLKTLVAGNDDVQGAARRCGTQRAEKHGARCQDGQ